MPTTRSGQAPKSSPGSASKRTSKRAADNAVSPKAKRGKTEKPMKDQKTIEETMDGIETIEDDKDIESQLNEKKEKNGSTTEVNATLEHDLKIREDAVKEREDEIAKKEQDGEKDSRQEGNSENNGEAEKESEPKAEIETEKNGTNGKEKNAFDEVKADENEVNKAAKEEEAAKSKEISSNNKSVVEDEKREAAMPSSILEKGIIYFFFRGRVGIQDPQGVDDIARSYIVLRPLPIGAKLGEGPLEDSGNARLLALPKKVLPMSHQDRFLMFVEKSGTTIQDLKDNFISGSTHATKTAGTSHIPSATPIAEGIYAITSTGRESHLAYHITVPAELGEVQKDLGLNEKGSYVISAKNPTASAPANANIGKDPEYPESIMDKFRGRRWMPLEPELLDYANTQFLIIGEGLGNIDAATKEMGQDKKDDEKEKPIEEMNQLEEEDSFRVEHMKGDDPVFGDLGLSSKEYHKLQTTW